MVPQIVRPGILLPFLLSLLMLVSCSRGGELRRSIQSLGTVISITIYDQPRPGYFEESFAIVREIHDLMSLEVEDSDLLRLKEAAGREALPLHPHTLEVLEEALRISERSSGAFTPLIEPLVSLWGIAGEEPRVPSGSEIELALANINSEDLEILPSNELS